jgi:hypothetical protein
VVRRRESGAQFGKDEAVLARGGAWYGIGVNELERHSGADLAADALAKANGEFRLQQRHGDQHEANAPRLQTNAQM